ncbi:CopG family transcriptional regulator [Schaalia sp. Marseille-Q2122]|uniref:ribbon-helix-helix domain-containing protein n=1 Tax=Schaalia sp. Marseille-Q2122 TaxID=2736604 RepID=UPI0015885254|nr:CopG family transcriptional regulator [Schaalia sp. Marseille-Q2122]
MSTASVKNRGRKRLGIKGSGASPKRQVRLSEEINDRLDEEARRQGVTASEVIREAIDAKLRELDAVQEGEEVYFAQDGVTVYDVMLETMYALDAVFTQLSYEAPNEEQREYWTNRSVQLMAEKDSVGLDDIRAMRECMKRWDQIRTDIEYAKALIL